MTSAESKKLLRTFLEALWSGDKETAKSVFADDAEWWFPSSVGYKRPMHPAEAIDVVMDDMIGRFDESEPFNVEVHHIFAEGDEAAAEYTAIGTTVSGREYNHRYVVRATARDGKIVTVRPWFDTKYFIETLFGD